MKGRTGKKMDSPKQGDKEFEQDLSDNTEKNSRSGPGDKKIVGEAEERKHGGRSKRKRGGKTEMKCHGEESKMHAGRKPRKSGGRAGSDQAPFSSARSGKNPPGHKAELID